jgi:hypothetical protein
MLDNAIRWNRGVETSITPLLQKLDPQHRTGFPYPTLVWLSRDGVQIAVRPNRIDAIVNSVSTRFEAAPITPQSRKFLHSQYQFASLPGSIFGTPEDGVGAFALPDSNSQLVFTLPKNRGFRGVRRTTVNGESWIELSVYDEAWAPGYFVRADQVRPAH